MVGKKAKLTANARIIGGQHMAVGKTPGFEPLLDVR